ncbi:hypothetical protein FACS189454_02430 [Planctomycetales bacterium]|nr:hypothetical protein FACS189454_02430 [Planctomycetales bacterium]
MENYFAQWNIRNEVCSPQTACQLSRHHAIHIMPYQQWTWKHHSATFHWHSERGLFDSKSITPVARQFFQWEYKGTQRRLIPIILSAFNLTDIYQKYNGSFDSVFFQLAGIADAFDANNGEPRLAQIAGTWASQLFCSGLLPVCYESFNPAQNNALTFQYNQYTYQQTSSAHCWDALVATLALCSIRWDAVQSQYFAMPLHHRAFVRPGWKLLAKNIITDECFELGFIDADTSELVLPDVFLPNGGYEISVLTSSLFWKDAYAPTGHFLNVCDDNECLALPQIYHLRSSVSRGRTTVQWSATPNGDEDCLFLLWYSSDVPADPQQPPDKTLWYFPHQTEYQTTFSQKTPAWLFTIVETS